MRLLSRIVLSLLVAGAMGTGARAFSLYGPFESWMTVDIGYQLPGAEIGGPMALGNGYRWNTPVIVYGYDASFLNYFGAQGVKAIDKAFAILNALPKASAMSPDLHEFLLDTRHFNYQAQALGIVDLTSTALSEIIAELGVAPAERYTWTLRSRVVINNVPNYTVIKRSYDPVTLVPSSYVNGTLYTYRIEQTYANPDTWEAVEISVDPYAPSVTTVAALAGLGGGTTDTRGQSELGSPGMIYTGLTRDDVGALHYLLSPANLVYEILATNSVASPSGSSPWGFPGIGAGATNSTVVTNASSTNLVLNAVRPGVDKLTFRKAEFDSTFGVFFTNNVVYTDIYLTNGVQRQQSVQRILTTPDIVFSAGDLGVNAVGIPILIQHTVNPFVKSPAATGNQAGPGIISPPIAISFSSLLPYFFNSPEGSEETATRSFVWGSFDVSTNAPIVFPNNVSIQQIEQTVLSGSGKPDPWRLPGSP